SIDAGADQIDVQIEEGGSQLIRVSDNGNGIAQDELPLAVAPHATSKITAAEDLEAIGTLGFRGEALASIASVSRLRLSSRATVDGRLEESAYVIEVSGEQVAPVQPAAASAGTVIEVRDLFFNTPARRKFMRTVATEAGHIADTINRIAIVHPHVGFTLAHNGRKTIELPSSESWQRRAMDVLGRELEEALLAFEQEDLPTHGSKRVRGMAGLPNLARATAKYQYVCVNGRPVKDRNIQHAIKEAYRGLIPPDRQPLLVLLLDMDPHEVDVNVHPTKAEVRFRNSSGVHGMVLSAIRQRLLMSDLTPSAQFNGTGGAAALHAAEKDSSSFTLEPATNNAAGASTSNFVEYFRRMDPKQKGLAFQEVKRALAEEDPSIADDLLGSATDNESENGTGNAFGGVTNQSILQVHQSYVVTQDDDGLVIVDQHALHERVMFEELSGRVLREGQTLESQRLLMPVVLDASVRRQAMLDQLKPLLERIGIEVEPMGKQSVAVHAFPSFLFDRHVEPGPFMDELLDAAEEGAFDTAAKNAEEAALHKVLDMMACKAAVKAGDRLSEQELAALLQRRQEVERSSNCPHGRPTTLRLTLKDLARQFGRT
ncbi:MAG: DNA mismatch repair endonuclease MutL, partial [Rhodospirillales bacterium]|nr:DNA mismatch repair endonuclease MutL [Rhodospirillales bacterium]